MSVLIWAVIGYAAGCLPLSRLVSAKNLPSSGSGVEGARALTLLRSATWRGKTAWVAVDVLKGLLPLLAAGRGGVYEAAACAVGVVAGHCWPPASRRTGGRGLAPAAGASIVLLPVELVLGSLLALTGVAARIRAAASTMGLVLVPAAATWRGQPAPYRFAAWIIVAMILARRIDGVSDDISRGTSAVRAVFRRLVLDVSDRPSA